MNKRKIARVGLAIAAAGALIAGTTVPASAAKRTTVVIVTSNELSGLNSSVSGYNLTINSDVGYLSGNGFNYYDNKKVLQKNTALGTYKILSQKPFRVQYTVNKGKVWSDGTPITGVDLLLSHILSSTTYSVAAGLGDPNDAEQTPAFDSLGYGGAYDEHHVGLPTLSADKMSVVVEYDAAIPDWEIVGPGPSPVHTLVHLAAGKTKLQSVAANNAAKAQFEKAFNAYNGKFLKGLGAVWSKSYNINSVTSSTNPLLLVGNGAYLVKSITPGQGISMVRNPRYNSGPKLQGNIKSIQFRYIKDGTAAAQALRNKEIDVYSGQPTADSVALLKSIPTAKVISVNEGCYEHIDLNVGPTYGTDYTYNGVFAGDSQKAKDLRTATLLAWPRQQIVDTIIKPINKNAVLMQTFTVLPSDPRAAAIMKESGIMTKFGGSQSEREAKALALVQKHFPSASATNPGFDVTVVHAANNARRASEAQLAKAALAKAGINLLPTAATNWSSVGIISGDYDAEFFAWCQTSTSAASPVGTYATEDNYQGYANKKIDDIYAKLKAKAYSFEETGKLYAQVDKEIVDASISLPIFQFPGVTGVNKQLKGIKPALLSPLLVWNYWEWRY
ncbi:MAG: hypothetical protein RLZZ12_750 [Actinomycetota bacterium]|jgi:peptide/nickel transport system substrate-binding protein